MLLPRDDGLWTTNDGARWAFFAIFIVIIIVVVLGTLRVNKKRSRQGLQPIYGTRWMTPPSYNQSQTQYDQPNQRDPDMPQTYVPTYTATANEFDMGYYDARGEFHANPNAKTSAPFQYHTDTDPVAYPESAHQRTGSASSAGPATTIDNESLSDLRRPGPEITAPAHPPPHLSEGSSSTLPSFHEGSQPPPVREKNA